MSQLVKEHWHNLDKDTVQGSKQEWIDKAFELQIRTILSNEGRMDLLEIMLGELEAISKVCTVSMFISTEIKSTRSCLFCHYS